EAFAVRRGEACLALFRYARRWLQGDACVAPTEAFVVRSGEACLALFRHARRWLQGDACVAPTNLGDLRRARHCLALFRHERRWLQGDACVAPTEARQPARSCRTKRWNDPCAAAVHGACTLWRDAQDRSVLSAGGEAGTRPGDCCVWTLLIGAVLIGVLIPLLLKHFRLTPSCPRLSAIVGYTRLSPVDNAELGHARVLAASTSLPRLRRGWPGQARP
ncbi:MAG: hypothetical protein QOD29_5240, partial [Alphaproteobacteria bacterium]|nr:hypothetical protein [Alphaproteobacteria bacterium]